MTDKIAEIEPKYRTCNIEIYEHGFDGIDSIHLGGAVIYGKPRLKPSPNPAIEIWDKKNDKGLIVSEFLTKEEATRIATETEIPLKS